MSADVYGECRSQPTVVTDEATIRALNTSADYRRAWSEAEEKAKAPAHSYLRRRHAVAIYMYTGLLKPVQRHLQAAGRKGRRRKRRFDSRSLHADLSEALQVLKHSQVTCLHTALAAETLLTPNISSRLVRFSTFMLGSDRKHLTQNASCFLVHTCFGADVSHYSASKESSQVLIPPYEVFRVVGVWRNSHRCKVVYRLESNPNCVYDTDSSSLHPISASPVDGFWLMFIILCLISIPLVLPLVIVKVLDHHKKNCCSYNLSGE